MEKRIRTSDKADDGEFGIYKDMAYFPLSECPAYLQVSIGGICVSGAATIQIFNTRFRIGPDMVITLLPWQFASIHEITEDFQILFFKISLNMFTDSLSSLWRLSPGFFFYMQKHIVSAHQQGYNQRFKSFCDLLAYRADYAPPNCRRESIMQLLRVYYWDVYTVYLNDPTAMTTRSYTRKEELAFRFMRMIVEKHLTNMEVGSYAQELGVSSKYLTSVVKNISGRSARDWIVYYTILEIKSLLREASMELKTIVYRVNFPDQSTLSRFFRRYTGMTPSQYRKKIHI